MGRSQAARHRVLVPGSQVRILPPQPTVPLQRAPVASMAELIGVVSNYYV